MSSNALPLKGIHHVELLVGNAKQAACFYRKVFGFSQVSYAGPETGLSNQASYVLQQGDIRLVLSTPLMPEDPMSERHRLHTVVQHGLGTSKEIFNIKPGLGLL